MQSDKTYFGNIVGRVANRIQGAQFTLNGTHYQLVPNEGDNMLHGIKYSSPFCTITECSGQLTRTFLSFFLPSRFLDLFLMSKWFVQLIQIV